MTPTDEARVEKIARKLFYQREGNHNYGLPYKMQQTIACNLDATDLIAADPLTAHAAWLKKKLSAVISDRDLKRDELTALTAEHAQLKADAVEQLEFLRDTVDDAGLSDAIDLIDALLDRLRGGVT